MTAAQLERMHDRLADQLRSDGYVIVRAALPYPVIEALDADLARAFEETPFGEGSFYGPRTKRFGRLLARSGFAQQLVLHPIIRSIVEPILLPRCDVIQLNVAQAIAVHPGSLQQMPHRDHDMWRIGPGETEYLVNVIWPFTRFTAANGATLVWPGTHGPNAQSTELSGAPIVAEMAPGDALLFLGSTAHGAGANRTNEVRRGCVIGYSLGWLKTYENQFLAYPPEVARSFSPELAALVGYRQHRPNLGNYEGQCPSVVLHGTIDAPLGAIDALRPDQVAMVDAFAEDQRRMQ
ncbi:MAG TPA: phytanoyl-CoA dioxygenase family protein [Sphingomonas sp.]|uniref:phytanoyl-CoA dioxygenase family protein n=1 Tax=Sphingomonas sp. TaxID=28214 RepID=UPI002BB1447C|nr:phytanoyl-CoA dioxygenase family protein [Sphingomonas sp.]HMI20855.1 phytanoyl-CoA dioxygenase family protein [Sphingomonas sp.]